MIDGIAVFRPVTGREHEQDARAGAVGQGASPQALPPGGKARRAVLTGVHPGQRDLVDLRAELREHGREQGQGRREHEDDREHDPEAHRAEGRARDEHHGGQRDQHGQPGEEHGLAGRIHRLGAAASTGSRSRRRRRGSDDDEQRIVDPSASANIRAKFIAQIEIGRSCVPR